jgi:tripartite ATP-independent transporter DctP family solute receptor
MIRRGFALCLAVVFGLMFAGCGGGGTQSEGGDTGGGEAAYTMKIAHASAPGSARDQGAQKVKEVVEAASDCSMAVEVYPASQLGGTTDLIEGMQIGSIESVILPAAFLGGFQPLMGAMDLPFFWPTDPEVLREVHDSDAAKQLLETTDEIGVTSLDIWHTGYKQWTANKPLRTPEDYQGLKVRAMPSPVLVKQDEVLGMDPISIDFAETYGALQNNAIDGQENPIDTIYDMKFHEVQDYMTMTDHGTLDQIFMVSKQWYDGLPAECQQVVENGVAEGRDVTYEKTYERIDEAKAAFEEAGMETVEISEEERQQLQEVTAPPVIDFYINENDQRAEELVQSFEQAIQEAEGQ